MAKNLWLKKALLGLAGGKALEKFDQASKACRRSQMKALFDILADAKDTVYGREHGFADILSIEEFRRKVPVNTFEDLRPYVDRIIKGEEDVLFAGKPVMYATTSGTTKEPKMVPVSAKYMKECYGDLSKIWLHRCLEENPDMLNGHDLSIVSKAEEGRTEDGVPYGAMGGHQYKNIPGFLKDVHCMPYEVFCIDDYELKYYAIARLAAAADITYAVTPNPSTFVQILRVLDEKAKMIMEDIELGGLRGITEFPDQVRRAIQPWLKPNVRRARELRRIYKEHKTLAPRDIWPNLSLVNVWKCGNSGLYLKKLEGAWPEKTVVRELAYQASECRGGITLSNGDTASVLTAHVNYFEFIPEEDMGKDDPRVLQAWELEKGARYNVLATTSSGLYRYDMNDILRVDGYYHEFPMVTFIQKGAGVTNLTGEKLYERQLIDSVREAQTVTGMACSFFAAFADPETSGYRLFAEFDKPHGIADLDVFRNTVDDILRRNNSEYESKRGSSRLTPLRLHLLVRDAFLRFKDSCVQAGQRDGQFKIVHLMHDDSKLAAFKALSVREVVGRPPHGKTSPFLPEMVPQPVPVEAPQPAPARQPVWRGGLNPNLAPNV